MKKNASDDETNQNILDIKEKTEILKKEPIPEKKSKTTSKKMHNFFSKH